MSIRKYLDYCVERSKCIFKNDWRVYFSFLILSFIQIRDIFFRSGIIGLNHDWQIPYYKTHFIKFVKQFLNVWVETNYGWSPVYPTDFVFRILSSPFIFFKGIFFSKFLVILSIFLSLFFTYKLCKYYKIDRVVSFFISIFYGFSAVMYNKIMAGHIYYLISYALFPLFYLFFLKVVHDDKDRFKNILVLVLLFSVLASQLQFIAVGALFVVTYLVFYLIEKKRFKIILWMIFFSILFLLVQSIWIFPLAQEIGKDHQILNPSRISLEYTLNMQSAGLNSFLLIGYVSKYFITSMKDKVFMGSLYVISFLTFLISAFLLIYKRIKSDKKKDYELISSLVVVIIGLFILYGSKFPMGKIFIYAFRHIFGLFIFREIYHSAIIVAFAYTLILIHIFKKRNVKKHKSELLLKKIIIMSIFFIVLPSFLFGYSRFLSNYTLSENFENLEFFHLNDSERYHTLWFPMYSPVSYKNSSSDGYFAPVVSSNKPPVTQTLTYSTHKSRLTNYLNLILHDDSSYEESADLIRKLNIKKIIYLKDADTKLFDYLGSSAYPEKQRLLKKKIPPSNFNNSKYSLVEDNEDFLLFEVEDYFPHEMSANLVSYFQGNYIDKKILNEHLEYFYENSSIKEFFISFSEKLSDHDSVDEVILVNPYQLDILSDFLDSDSILEPGQFTENSMVTKGWTDTHSLWYASEFYAGSNEAGASSRKENDSLTISKRFEKGDYEAYAKVVNQQRGGEFSILLNNQTIYSKNTEAETPFFEWVDVGNLTVKEGVYDITLFNRYGENAIFKLIFLNKDDKDKIEKNISRFFDEKNMHLFYELNLQSTKDFLSDDDPSLCTDIYVPKSDIYFIRFEIDSENAPISQDSIDISLDKDEINISKRVYISKDTHTFCFSSDDFFSLNKLYLFSNNDLIITPNDISVSKISYSEYKVNIVTENPDKPTFLVFHESYDPNWDVDKEGISAVRTNEVNNGFVVPNEILSFSIIHKKQDFLDIGLILSFSTIFIILSLLIVLSIYGVFKR